MSGKRTLHSLAKEYVCPTCGAQVGQKCIAIGKRKKEGRALKQAHLTRMWLIPEEILRNR